MGPVIVWLRQDLRLADNPALAEAAAAGRPVLPVYVLDDAPPWAPGAATRVWLHASLAALGAALEARGSRLVLRRGPAGSTLADLVTETGASAVYWNRRYEPAHVALDTELKRTLAQRCEVRSFNARLLFEPHRIATAGGTPYRVFTPFYRACLRAPAPPEPVPEPARLPSCPAVASLPLAALELEPSPDWAAGIRAAWTPGEAGALAAFERFLEGPLERYPEARDFPDAPGVSRLSPHLQFGEIGPRTLWHALGAAAAASGSTRLERAVEAWLRQLVWREFAAHVLFHFPHTSDAPLREEFADLAWRDAPEALAAWQHGRTGYPLVDAGMRELWHTGYMHNRVRMVAASFLCKHLGIHWLEGARWFWDTLVDADLANNTFGWQWSAGCGADAAPYFRIFNPVTQSRRFDPAGAYLRRWLPELANVTGKAVHEPGVAGYAKPVVEHRGAREAALDRYRALRG